ncbi:MAG: lipid IV(A) 3-deoxy-D-manno-octulosonic acid transferase [Gammaproteobacteria bacterium]|nr:lipid IV(A) 3-deoxy-D-manno-octulosonic acid transferase [Gammaproteobacteria bacterium]
MATARRPRAASHRRPSRDGRCLRFLYLLALYLAVPLVSAVFLWRGLRDRSYWHNFRERFGYGPRLAAHGVWLHAVSVGEVQACAPLVSALSRLHPGLPLTVTTFTPTGCARARALFGNLAQVRYVPFDLPGAVRRFFRRVQPRLAVIFETELWPNLYRECSRRRVPLVLASARISARSVKGYQRLGALFRDTLARTALVAAQGAGDAERFRSLGADPANTHVTGNIKFDFELPEGLAARGAQLRTQYAPDRPLWVAGSTHGGIEEQAVIAAQQSARRRLPGALLVLAPRHPSRFDEAAQALRSAGVAFTRRSAGAASVGDADCAVLLLDSLGELLEFYAAADLAFVGGSLVPIGGHNLLEPAALGVPILVGPHTANAQEIARLLIGRGAAEVVHDGGELAARVTALLADPAARERMGTAGRASVEANRGALGKLLALIEPLLEEPGSPGPRA